MTFISKAWRISSGVLVVAALLGVVLRLYPFYSFGPAYKYLLHTHSHVAVLGWLFAGFYLFMVWLFVPVAAQAPFRRLFYAMQMAVAGMLFTFPVQGYGPLSIPFSTLHILLSYVAVYRLVPFIRHSKEAAVLRYGSLLAIAFHLLATLGTWALAVVMAKKLKHTPAYDLAIKWYLHFEFQGWFMVAAFVIAAYFLLKNKRSKLPGWSLVLLLWTVASFGAYCLYLEWHEVNFPLLQLLRRAGILAELLVAAWWVRVVLHSGIRFNKISPFEVSMVIAFGAFVGRQLITALLWNDSVALHSIAYRSAIIGFLHWMHLGLFTHLLWGWASVVLPLQPQRFYMGLACFLAGFGLQETLLFAQSLPLVGQTGIFLSPWWLVIAAALLALGSAAVALAFYRSGTADKEKGCT